MKRVLAMLFSVFLSIQNNVGIQFSGDDAFVVGSYYTIQNTEQPDYRKLYTRGVQLKSADNCTPNTRMGKGLATIQSQSSAGLSAYWVAESTGATMSLSDVPDSNVYTYKEAGDIIAPLNCTIATSATSGGGHYMRLDSLDGKYTFVIENMERWYCCRYRKESGYDTHGNPVQWEHGIDVCGTTVNAGQLVGLAVEGTEIRVYATKSKSAINWLNFYNR